MNAVKQRKPPIEIDHRTIKLLIGWIAILITVVPAFFAQPPFSVKSISQTYWAGPWPQSLFVGFLFAIGAFMLAYNGFSKTEMRSSKGAAVSAFCVALFPCACGDPQGEIIRHVHYVAAAILFVILVYFCWEFRKRAVDKPWPQAKRRAWIYLVCAGLIVAAMVALLIDNLFAAKDAHVGYFGIYKFTYYAEAVGLIAFGFSWLLASRSLPFKAITHPEERFSPLMDRPPPDNPDIHERS